MKSTEAVHVETKELYVNSIGSLNVKSSIIIKGRVVLNKLTTSESASIKALSLNGIRQWTVIEHEDFENFLEDQENE